MRAKRSRASARRICVTARGLRTRFESAPLPGTITERPSGITPGGGGPGRPWRGWRTRLKEPGGSFPISSRVCVPTASRARAPARRRGRRRRRRTTRSTARLFRPSCRARLPAAREQESHERTREQELRLDRDADAVPAAAAVKDLLPAHTQPRHEVLEVRHRRRSAAEHGGVERATPRGEQRERGETAT